MKIKDEKYKKSLYLYIEDSYEEPELAFMIPNSRYEGAFVTAFTLKELDELIELLPKKRKDLADFIEQKKKEKELED